VWSAGQGTGAIDDVPAAADLVRRLIAEYRDAINDAALDPFVSTAQVVEQVPLS
jgi:nitronate monooxygenase